MIIRTTITKSGTGADGEANLHAVRTAEQTAVAYRHRQRVRLYLLRYGILDWSPTYLERVLLLPRRINPPGLPL